MRKFKQCILLGSAAASLALSVTPIQTFAVPNTRISIQCPDVRLRWPSTNGQSFLVEYRTALNPEVPWLMLTNFYLAAPSTNETVFVHSNQVQCPSGQSYGMMSATSNGGNGSSPSEFGLSALGSSMSLPNGLAEAVLDGQDFYLIEPPPMPSVRLQTNGVWVTLPWEVVYGVIPPIHVQISTSMRERASAAILQGEALTDSLSALSVGQTESDSIPSPDGDGPGPFSGGTNGSVVGSGFYRVVNVTPKVVPDFFGVEQDSFQNQLDVLRTVIEPNDDQFLISTVTSAHHGNLSYTQDGSIFQYTPTNGFYGVDSFSYTVTNFHKSFATANVTVFVNKAGNSQPQATDVTITLSTNSYSAVLNAITNSFDPDGDTNTLFALRAPRLGGVTTNAGGDIFYSRNADFFGDDTFTYLITDGNGGYAIGSVTVQQIDSDGDGMPDEYEMRSGLDMTLDDTAGDPDNDGLPNLAEFTLHTNPHLSDNSLSLAITNGAVLAGFVQIAIPALDPVIGKQPISLYVNGTPAAHSILWQGPDGTWFLNWDTSYLTNGAYNLAAGYQFRSEPATGQDGVIFGHTNNIYITNFVTFVDLTSQFTDFLIVDTKLIVSNATFRVDLYDEGGSPLVYATGSTTNGRIQLYWDLTDGSGNQISFGNIKANFTLSGSGVPPGPQPISKWFLKEAGTGGADFVVAWGWDVYSSGFNNRRTQCMLDGVINLIGNPSVPSYTLAPAANQAYANAFRFDTTDDGELLLHTIASPTSGNFFWYGHGAKDNIAGNFKKTRILPGDIEGGLKNHAIRSTPRHPVTNKHPYKFVVLNGCNTYSDEWANAFGIDWDPNGSSRLTVDYRSAGREPRAFVGWVKSIDVPNRYGSFIGNDPEYAEGLGQLFFNWMQGNFLGYSLTQYASKMSSHGFGGHDSWKISGCSNMTRAD